MIVLVLVAVVAVVVVVVDARISARLCLSIIYEEGRGCFLQILVGICSTWVPFSLNTCYRFKVGKQHTPAVWYLPNIFNAEKSHHGPWPMADKFHK